VEPSGGVSPSPTEAVVLLQKLQTVSDVALQHLSPDQLLDELLDRIRGVLETNTCAVLLLDKDTNELVARAAKGLEEEVERGLRIPVGKGFAGRIVAERRSILLPDVDHADVLNPLLREKGIKTLLGAPLVVDGELLGVIHVGTLTPRDFTPSDIELLELVAERVAVALQRAMVHQELVRLEARERSFIALASHELRTPAAVIYGISETLSYRGDDLSAEVRAKLRTALHEASIRLRQLVEQLLDLSKLDAGAPWVRPRPLQLRQRVVDVLAGLEPEYADKVRIDIPHAFELEADPEAIDRIVGNLILNALNHGTPPVIVGAEARDQHVYLTVEDRGEGVPDEFVPFLFERFRRGPDAGEPGAGLGLAIAQAYAIAHGGNLSYEDASPCGALFRVTLPRSSS
jgi:signal transduction histidine kinase